MINVYLYVIVYCTVFSIICVAKLYYSIKIEIIRTFIIIGCQLEDNKLFTKLARRKNKFGHHCSTRILFQLSFTLLLLTNNNTYNYVL